MLKLFRSCKTKAEAAEAARGAEPGAARHTGELRGADQAAAPKHPDGACIFDKSESNVFAPTGGKVTAADNLLDVGVIV